MLLCLPLSSSPIASVSETSRHARAAMGLSSATISTTSTDCRALASRGAITRRLQNASEVASPASKHLGTCRSRSGTEHKGVTDDHATLLMGTMHVRRSWLAALSRLRSTPARPLCP